MDILVGELVNTAGSVGVTELVQELLADSILDRRIRERWIANIEAREAPAVKAQRQVDFAAYKALKATYVALGHSAAWKLQGEDGSYEDANIAARLFSVKTDWRRCMDDVNYERIAARIAAL